MQCDTCGQRFCRDCDERAASHRCLPMRYEIEGDDGRREVTRQEFEALGYANARRITAEDFDCGWCGRRVFS